MHSIYKKYFRRLLFKIKLVSKIFLVQKWFLSLETYCCALQCMLDVMLFILSKNAYFNGTLQVREIYENIFLFEYFQFFLPFFCLFRWTTIGCHNLSVRWVFLIHPVKACFNKCLRNQNPWKMHIYIQVP